MTALIEIANVTRRFERTRGDRITAVANVSLEVPRGSTLGLVGESGSGKTTLGRIAVMLLRPDEGGVTFDGIRIDRLDPANLQRMRRRFQYVFQDPAASLNPRMTVGEALREPLLDHRICDTAGVGARVKELLDLVELGVGLAGRFPHELSGGQVQRAGIARALTVEPEFLVLDEPVSSLDLSVQAQLLTLFADLQGRLGLTYLLVSHDLGVIGQLAETTAVMHAGRIVESGPTAAVLSRPRHPYTARLVESIPSVAPGDHLTLTAPMAVVKGTGAACSYFDRCGHPDRDDRCRAETPRLVELDSGTAACHHAQAHASAGGD